jgi:protein-tyrosine phosphatase
LEFVAANKVTHVVNCAGLQIPNHWEPIGVQYLTFNWLDTDQQIILDAKDQVANACFAFVEDAIAKTESTLVHSVKGQSRAATVLAAYMMRKYRWSLLKTFQFLSYRRPDLEVRSAFIQQLAAYEARLQKTPAAPRTTTWGGMPPLLNGRDLGSHLRTRERGTHPPQHLRQRHAAVGNGCRAPTPQRPQKARPGPVGR